MAELTRSHYDVIAIHNIDDEDFDFQYDASKGNPPYTIPVGEVRKFPRFLANHALKHLIDKIMQKRDIRISNLTVRQELAEEIVVGEEVYQRAAGKTPDEELAEDIAKMNVPSELDRVLTRKKKAEEVTEPAKKEVEEKFEGLEEKPKPVAKPKVELEEIEPMPTRKEIYNYAENTLKMVLDDKTKKKLDKMQIKELLKQVGDPREAII